jgi:DNA-binding MarR family transcriptional regulator
MPSPTPPADTLTGLSAEGVPVPPLLDRVGYLLAKTHVGIRERGNRLLEPLRLDVMQYGALTVLALEGPVSQQTLAEMIRCDRTTMVAIVDRLEGAGYVERERNPTDRRAYALKITPKGKRAQIRGKEIVRKVEDEFLAPLSPDERTALLDMLRRLLLASA